jgi:hypothetical protein
MSNSTREVFYNWFLINCQLCLVPVLELTLVTKSAAAQGQQEEQTEILHDFKSSNYKTIIP